MKQIHPTRPTSTVAGWTTKRSPLRVRLLWTAAAAASTTLHSQLYPAASGFALQAQFARENRFAAAAQKPPPQSPYHQFPVPSSRSQSHPSSQHRPLFTNRKARRSHNDPDQEGGFLQKVGRAVKGLLPSSWFQSDEERRRALQRRKVQDEISGGLSELLRDAPFPVRAMGQLIQPLVSSAMSGLAETMAEQQDAVETVLRAARSCLENDPAVERALGAPLIVSPPFSQSSSTSSINGVTSRRLALAFNVQGSLLSAVARVSATSSRSNSPPTITQLQLQTSSGRVLNVATTYSSRKRSFVNGDSRDDDTIIEAEIVEKKSKL